MPKFLYYPTKPWIVGQKFGETAFLDYYKKNGVIFTGHNGIDAAAIHGQEVYAAHDGIVEVQVDSKQGHGVVIRSQTLYDYAGQEVAMKTIYWHLIDSIPLKTGQEVKAGDLVGYADSTGLSTGDHLHFALKPMIKKDGLWINLLQDNGVQGCIDPSSYFNGKYAQDLSDGKYIFTVDMEMGDYGEDVYQLQRKLQKMGYFPMAQNPTKYYGSITRGAVFAFQMDYITNLNFLERNIYRGRFFGQKSRAALNNI